MFKGERQKRILQQLKTDGSVRVVDLAYALDVNPVTIRRDLAELEAARKLHRVHGGAVVYSVQTSDPSPSDLEFDQRRRIAEAAARFISNQSAVFLGPGTLTQGIVAFLNEHTQLTLITNSLAVAWQVAQQHRHTLHVTGGQISQDFGIYGDVETFRRVGADMVILEAHGLDAERGFTHDLRNYANMARALLTLSSQTILLVPAERLGRSGAIFVAPANEIDVLITGREAATPPLWDLSELGLRIILT